MKQYKYFIFILAAVLGSASLGATISEDAARADAIYILQQMHKALYALEDKFSKSPAYPHDPKWVAAKLKAMAVTDQLLRRIFVENAMREAWPYSIRRVWVEYFINFDADLTNLQTLGFLQINDLYQYTYLKQLMHTSGALETTGGWPIISVYGKHSDYYAFLIAQHGQAFDEEWQGRILIPQLKTLAELGESSVVAYSWLSHPEPHNMDEIARLMELEGGIWAETIPEVSRMQHFFLELPVIMKADRIAPLLPR